MSFSNQVKDELCNAKFTCKGCRFALMYGMILAGKSGAAGEISFSTKSKPVVDLFTECVVETVGAIVTIRQPDILMQNVRPTYHVQIENQADISSLSALLTESEVFDRDNFNWNIIKKGCCRLAFLRGIYLTCGTITDPSKEYHIEFRFHYEKLCYTVSDLLDEQGFDFKVAERSKHMILYAKESQQIEDILTALGAVKSSMGLMNLKIEKDLRNTVNRRTNCETANIGKTVNASVMQVQKIEKIIQTIGLDALPAQIREAAQLRLDNPEASLSELCELVDNKISRSGLNHRLKKLCTIADGIV